MSLIENEARKAERIAGINPNNLFITKNIDRMNTVANIAFVKYTGITLSEVRDETRAKSKWNGG